MTLRRCIVCVCAAVVGQIGAVHAESVGRWRTVIIPAPVIDAWQTAVLPVPLTPRAARPPITTASLPPRSEPVAKPLVGMAHETVGIASFYWQDQMTASGERFDRRAMTAAHKTLPLGTRVRVTHMMSGRSVVVRINDRGPFKPGRVIDLSEAAAETLAMTAAGLAHVRIDVVQ